MSRILIVEDHSDIRRLIRWSLEFEGHELQEATHGEAGLALARSWRPDLVLMDVMMPGAIDGYEVCRQIKADPQLAGTPVIMLTARAQASDRQAGDAAGADAYISKPFSPMELSDAVERLLATVRQDGRKSSGQVSVS